MLNPPLLWSEFLCGTPITLLFLNTRRALREQDFPGFFPTATFPTGAPGSCVTAPSHTLDPFEPPPSSLPVGRVQRSFFPPKDVVLSADRYKFFDFFRNLRMEGTPLGQTAQGSLGTVFFGFSLVSTGPSLLFLLTSFCPPRSGPFPLGSAFSVLPP